MGFIKLILVMISALILIPIIALFSGTLLWMIWPVVMVPVFGLKALGWWQAVCLVWISGILLKPTVKTEKD